MPDKIREDARHIRKLIREAEARLKQAMVRARQNPDVNVDAGQRALLRLTQAESQALSLSTSLLRVHDELSKVARETMGVEDGTGETVVSPSAIAETPALIEA